MRNVSIILIIMFVAGCASGVRSSGYRNPSYTKEAPIENIAVVAKFKDFGINETAELAFDKYLQNYGYPSLGIKLFPPMQEVKKDSIPLKFKANDVQAVLIVASSEFWESIDETKKGVRSNISSIVGAPNKKINRTGPTALVEMRLFNMKSEKIWIGSAEIASRKGYEPGFDWLAYYIVENLNDNEII